MGRLFSLFACIALLVSLGTGSLTHALEPIGCIDASQSLSDDHSAGDADQVPADAEKAYPHHHGGCHGHHLAAPLDSAGMAIVSPARSAPFGWQTALAADAPTHSALRPPIA
jgi:hypothetical protein